MDKTHHTEARGGRYGGSHFTREVTMEQREEHVHAMLISQRVKETQRAEWRHRQLSGNLYYV